jgi:hypothetical protein
MAWADPELDDGIMAGRAAEAGCREKSDARAKA